MNIDALSTKEKDDCLRTLLHYMPQDIRRQLMISHPVAYVKMSPRTSSAVLARVRMAVSAVSDGH